MNVNSLSLLNLAYVEEKKNLPNANSDQILKAILLK